LLLRILDCKINKRNIKRIRRIKIKFEKGRIKQEEEEEEVGSLSHLGHAKRDFILKRKKEKKQSFIVLVIN
jgi:hypothetical protein